MTNSAEQESCNQPGLRPSSRRICSGGRGILKDYDESSALITPDKTYRGWGNSGFFQAFLDGAEPAFWSAFKVTSKSTVREVAYLAWEAKPWVTLATDTLVVKNGKIAVQTFSTSTCSGLVKRITFNIKRRPPENQPIHPLHSSRTYGQIQRKVAIVTGLSSGFGRDIALGVCG